MPSKAIKTYHDINDEAGMRLIKSTFARFFQIMFPSELLTMASPLSLDTAEYEFLVSPLTSVQKLPVLREPASQTCRMTFGAVSDVGKVRTRNDDHYMVAQMRRSLSVLDHNLPRE
ncbi:MAG TPA: hypothetical protein VJY33_14365, partial [Isosphaeraceae bacterium]|nr:hypothetical protein [Isosphaeraceae bacterium]